MGPAGRWYIAQRCTRVCCLPPPVTRRQGEKKPGGSVAKQGGANNSRVVPVTSSGNTVCRRYYKQAFKTKKKVGKRLQEKMDLRGEKSTCSFGFRRVTEPPHLLLGVEEDLIHVLANFNLLHVLKTAPQLSCQLWSERYIPQGTYEEPSFPRVRKPLGSLGRPRFRNIQGAYVDPRLSMGLEPTGNLCGA